mgnify:FL=1
MSGWCAGAWGTALHAGMASRVIGGCELHYLAGFSRQFMLALGLWPFASLMLTLPVLAILYRRDGRLRFWSALGAYLSVLYLLALMCFTLYPLPSGDAGLGITYGVAPQLDFWVFIDDIKRDGKVAVLQLLANVVFFVPLGIIVGRGLRKGFGWALVLGFLVSLFVETAQLTGLFWIYPFAYRTFDVDDLACNTLGCVIGWCLAAVINRLMPVRRDDGCGLTVETHPGIVRRTVALCLDMTIVVSVTGIMCAGALLCFVLGQILADSLAGVGTTAVETWTDSSDADSNWMFWIFFAVFLLVEVVIPWCHEGSTPGGSFVRMTCEEYSRRPLRRVLFYVVRLVVLVCAGMFAPVALPVLAIFYAVTRRMPYDYV